MCVCVDLHWCSGAQARLILELGQANTTQRGGRADGASSSWEGHLERWAGRQQPLPGLLLLAGLRGLRCHFRPPGRRPGLCSSVPVAPSTPFGPLPAGEGGRQRGTSDRPLHEPQSPRGRSGSRQFPVALLCSSMTHLQTFRSLPMCHGRLAESHCCGGRPADQDTSSAVGPANGRPVTEEEVRPSASPCPLALLCSTPPSHHTRLCLGGRGRRVGGLAQAALLSTASQLPFSCSRSAAAPGALGPPPTDLPAPTLIPAPGKGPPASFAPVPGLLKAQEEKSAPSYPWECSRH